jgi:DNA (cytosine-5)-methyltransferase 1
MALDVVLDAIKHLAERESLDWSVFSDPRSGLVTEPLRWALDALDSGTSYETVCLEQVPTVLPVWEAMADVLRREGYSVVTGCLRAEQFGVPQTRRRAFLVARLGSEARLPEPTHRHYRKGVAQHEGDQSLLPWVSMADALGWKNPRVVVSNYGTGGDPANRGTRTSSEPSATVTSKIDRFKVHPIPANAGTTPDDMDWVYSRPSPTIVGSFAPDVVAAPAWRKAGDGPRQNAKGSVRITHDEAAVLQTFPADHPWQGTKGKHFEQVGNAVPCLLAKAVLEACTGTSSTGRRRP